MTDPLIEEAAKVAKDAWGMAIGHAQGWRDAAIAMRTFWAAHTTPAGIDKAAALRVAARHYEGHNEGTPADGRNYGVTMTDFDISLALYREADRLDRDQAQAAEAERIGQAAHGWFIEKLGLNPSFVTYVGIHQDLGRFVLDLVGGAK